jgi:hypothetical protein
MQLQGYVMSNPNIRIIYDGGDANANTIDAKLFGQSLQGIDKLISDALIIITQERLPKKGERAPLILKAREPKPGSFVTDGYLQETVGLLALGYPIITTIGTDILSHYITAAVDFFRGRDRTAEMAIEAIAKLHQDTVVANDRTDERRHIEQMGMQELLRLSIASNGASAINYVSPVGRSVSNASFIGGTNQPITVDENGADEIRQFDRVEWLAVGSLRLKTDGFKFHTNGLSVENPEGDGYFMADVNDPAFEEESNAYTVAAQKRSEIEVLARKGYKNNKLAKIQIVDFVREIE